MFKKYGKTYLKQILMLICMTAAFVCSLLVLFINSVVTVKSYADSFNVSPNLETVSVWSYSGSQPSTTFSFNNLTKGNITPFQYELENDENKSTLKIARTEAGYHTWEMCYVQFKSKITVPAHKGYAVTYNCKVIGARTSGSATMRAELIGYGESSVNASTLYLASGSNGSICKPDVGTATDNYEIELCNSSDSEKDYYVYFALYNSSGAKSNRISATCEMSCSVSLLNEVAIPEPIGLKYIEDTGTTYYYETDFAEDLQIKFLNTSGAAQGSTTSPYGSFSFADATLSVYRAATFTIRFTIKDGYMWNDETSGTGARIYSIKVNKSDPTIIIETIKTCNGILPEKVPIVTAESTAGEISWAEGATVQNPAWTFYPDNIFGFNEAEGVAEIIAEHNLGDMIEGFNPTCTSTGAADYWTCSVCNKMFADEDGNEELTDVTLAIDETAHNASASWSMDNSNHWHICTYNNEHKVDVEEHSWNGGEVTKAATCTQEGERTYTCTVCQTTKTESIDVTGHNFVEAWTSDSANHWHICANECGETGDSAAHEWGEATVTKEPTEDKEGEQKIKCTVCNYEKTESIPALGHTHKFAEGWTYDETNHWHASTCGHGVTDGLAEHSWNGGEITKAATCTQEGERTYTCTVCQTTKTESVDKTDHETESHEGKKATCTEIGWNAYETCRNCDYTTYKEIPASGHTEVTDEAVAPTCTETGLTEGKHCSVCEEVLSAQEEVAALGHFREWQITKQPTEDETGLKQNICTVCGDIDGEEVIAKLVSDEGGNGGVIDLEPDKVYDLEIAVKESDVTYNIAGVSKGYKVELFVVDGENRTPYDDSRTVTLMLVIPEGMEENFTLYRRHGDILEPVAEESYNVDGRTLTIRTTLSAEFVFNMPLTEEPQGGIPWWVWLIVAIAVLAVIILIVVIVIAKNRKDGNGGTPVAAAVPAATTTVIKEGTQYDDAALKAQLAAQSKKLDELMERETPAGALEKGLSDEEMRSYFTDGEIISMVNAGKLSREDGNRIISGRKK